MSDKITFSPSWSGIAVRRTACFRTLMSRPSTFLFHDVILRNAGLLTSGEIDSVRLVGPIEPATKRGWAGVLAVHSSAAARASRAPSS